MRVRQLLLLLLLVLPCATAAQADTSKLWGKTGELFDARGRLMDWSYAGYAAGEAPLPWHPASVAVTEFGAAADDNQDDTDAFTKAIAALKGSGGVIAIPAGRFIISNQLKLTNGIVLRGAGSKNTTIFIPVSFTDLQGNPGLDAGEHSSYMIEPGFLRAGGKPEGDTLATITAKAARGDTTIKVSSTKGFAVGHWIMIRQTDVNGTLLKRLHADLMQPNEGGYGESWSWRSRVTAVGNGQITLERPLPLDIELAWSPTVIDFTPTVSQVGVEHLTIRFPLTQYPGHFKEAGYNGIQFHRIANSWIRDVRILNADNPVKVTGCAFVTVTDIELGTTGSRGSYAGHHGLTFANGGDNLLLGFDVNTRFIHDLSTTFYVTGAVYADGRGTDICMDHHSRSPYGTLWTDIDLGAGTRPFASSGATSFHPHSAAYGTFWNIRANKNMSLPGLDTSGMGFGPRLNFVGFRTAATSGNKALQWHLEQIAPMKLEPANLWEAMWRKRLGDALTRFMPDPQLGDMAAYKLKTPARWDICVEDGDARLRINSSVYKAQSGDRLGEHALAPVSASGDVALQVSAKTAESLTYNPSADYALLFGFQDEDNYFYLMANGEAKYSQLFQVKDGTRTALATAAVSLIPDQGWHQLQLICEGGTINVRLDGVEVLQAQATTDCKGPLGVGSFNDAVYFDDIAIGAPPALAPDAGPHAETDAAAKDAGADAADAPAGDGSGTAAPRGSVSGCGCTVGARQAGAWPALGIMLLALCSLRALRRRRRRRSRRTG